MALVESIGKLADDRRESRIAMPDRTEIREFGSCKLNAPASARAPSTFQRISEILVGTAGRNIEIEMDASTDASEKRVDVEIFVRCTLHLEIY